MQKLKNIFKDLIYFDLYLIRNLFKPIFKFKEISVLLYHSVAKNNWYASVDPEVFEKQMAYLKAHYHVVNLDNIVSYVKGEGELADKSVAITFDDGYLDNFENAWPILKKHGLPFTVFLTTDLADNSGMNNGWQRLNWQQIKELASSGVEIGGHAQHHRDLDKLSAIELNEEIINCQKDFIEQLGQPAKHFSYPGGKFNETVIRAVQANGFVSACVAKNGLVEKGDDAYQIKRVWVHRQMSFFAFKARLTKVIDWVK